MLVLGFDVEEIYQLDRQIGASDRVAAWLRRVLKRREKSGRGVTGDRIGAVRRF